MIDFSAINEPRMLRLIRAILRDISEIEDITQDEIRVALAGVLADVGQEGSPDNERRRGLRNKLLAVLSMMDNHVRPL